MESVATASVQIFKLIDLIAKTFLERISSRQMRISVSFAEARAWHIIVEEATLHQIMNYWGITQKYHPIVSIGQLRVCEQSVENSSP